MSKRDSDRTVHASWEQMEVVRYNRAGKWFLEPIGFELRRQRVNLRAAAEYAVWAARERNGQIYFGQPGGNAFERLVVRLSAAYLVPAHGQEEAAR